MAPRFALMVYTGLVWSGWALATPPPETYQLMPINKQTQLIDPKLEQWFHKNVDIPDYLELPEQSFNKQLSKLPSFERDLLTLMRLNRSNKKDSQQIKVHMEKLKNATPQQKSHPLYPYYLAELIQSPLVSPDDKQTFASELNRVGGTSCPNKDLLLEQLSAYTKGFPDLESAKSFLARIQLFASRRFQKKALDEFLDSLQESHKQTLRSLIVPLAAPFDSLKDDHEWLLSDVNKKLKSLAGPQGSLDASKRSARKRSCQEARKHLLTAASLDKKHQFWDEVQQTAESVEQCYRRKGKSARIGFYNSIRNDFKKAYGFSGDAFAYGKVGSIYWGYDEFSKAKPIYFNLLNKAKQLKNEEVEAHVLFTLGRILENEGDFAKAVQYFDQFAEKYPNHRDTPAADRSIVLMATSLGQADLARQKVDHLIKEESQKSIDDRDTSDLSFGLFWGGRLHYEAGDQDLAEKLWHRGATEFYSTFYGAMSHYMLEKAKGQKFMIQPTLGPSFDFKNLTTSLSTNNHKTLNRILGLLKVGLRDDVACEMSEINQNLKESVSRSDYQRSLMSALILHASMEWLESIKAYSVLPRSFRNSLPVGFERLLFPKNYGNYVNKFSERLKLDPDIIYAIIRQESVFNPNAVSPAGARGLMQLMPATARLEARRLSRDYLPRKQIAHLIKQAKDRNRLLDAQTNVTIGVHHVGSLLERYKHPIFVLTSYNASPRATAKWQKKFQGSDHLEFIERIPYKETKSYVKLVLRNYFYYKRWYGSPDKDLTYLDEILPKSLKNLGNSTASVKRDQTSY